MDRLRGAKGARNLVGYQRNGAAENLFADFG